MRRSNAGLFQLIATTLESKSPQEIAEEELGILRHSPFNKPGVHGAHNAMMKAKACEKANEHLRENRFSNILPFDSNLVTCSAGYVNASLVKPLGRPFIISQGPLQEPDTRPSFWSLVMKNNIKMIVSLAPFGFECADYIDEGPYGDFSVRVIEYCFREKDFSHKKLEVSANGKLHECHHVHFTAWPNYGLPSDRTEILRVFRLTEMLRAEIPECKTLVHCSGGVGRSGSFVAILSTWEHLLEAKDLEIDPETLKKQVSALVVSAVETMRQQRHPWMVEGLEQYTLIYQVLAQLCISPSLQA